jgi:hypothetical protein
VILEYDALVLFGCVVQRPLQPLSVLKKRRQRDQFSMLSRTNIPRSLASSSRVTTTQACTFYQALRSHEICGLTPLESFQVYASYGPAKP